MKKSTLDPLDKSLVRLLAEDGRISIKEMADRLGVAIPTVRSRLKKMAESGVLRTAGLIDPEKVDRVTLALVGLVLVRQEDLEEKLSQIAALDEVSWAGVVTGRYDIIAEVVCPGGKTDLYNFLAYRLPTLGGVRATESFILLKTSGKWIFPPVENNGEKDADMGGAANSPEAA